MEYLAELLDNPGLKLGLLVATLQVLAYLANYWLSRIFVGTLYRYLIAPGVIVHEYSHAVACILTGARIREVRLFEPTGGHVTHEEPRLPFGQGLISMAPVFGAALAVYLLARLLLPGFVGLGELDLGSWQIIVFGLLAASITAAMAPSKSDLSAGLVGWISLCVVIGLGVAVPGLSDYFEALAGEAFQNFLAVLVFTLIVLAALTAAAGAGYAVLQRTVRKDARYTVK